jgi:antitoxin ParD1/3/4
MRLRWDKKTHVWRWQKDFSNKHRMSITSSTQSNQALLAKFCQVHYPERMSTMNISLPATLKTFVDTQVIQRGYGTSSEYVRELIRKDQDRLQLREKLLTGASTASTVPVDRAYFDHLRDRVRQATPPITAP